MGYNCHPPRAPSIQELVLVIGGPKEARTPDLFHAMEALYQLSYGPMTTLNSDLRIVEAELL